MLDRAQPCRQNDPHMMKVLLLVFALHFRQKILTMCITYCPRREIKLKSLTWHVFLLVHLRIKDTDWSLKPSCWVKLYCSIFYLFEPAKQLCANTVDPRPWTAGMMSTDLVADRCERLFSESDAENITDRGIWTRAGYFQLRPERNALTTRPDQLNYNNIMSD